MMINAFSCASTPILHFGVGKISVLPSIINSYGKRVLLVTGSRSFDSSFGPMLVDQWQKNGIQIIQHQIDKEPSPAMIDAVVKESSRDQPDVVVSIGGGSALDAGKAIAAMLPLNESVKEYLEGVGTKVHPGLKIPFVAVPTTSGTGSEATKNAVLSETGEMGYKKSLRHNNFVPNVAVIDPALTATCPPPTTAASGMDAFTQLLESYLSTAANPITDSLAVEGLKYISKSLLKAYRDGSDLEARTDMAMAAYLSGITLANAGLGLVHGFASSIGGYFKVPHGVICSSLMPAANKVTVKKLRREKNNNLALKKYSTIGRMFTNQSGQTDDFYADALLKSIAELASEMKIPTPTQFGITSNNFQKIINATDNKNNPVGLNAEEMFEVLTLAG